MESSLLASGLGFPEGPTVLGDGRIVLCDGNTGELLAYQDGNMSLFARTGGPPPGTHPGPDNKMYIKPRGGAPPRRHVTPLPPRQPASPDRAGGLLFSPAGGSPPGRPS